MSLSIKVKVSPGARIEDTFLDACKLASQLQVSVDFNFNDVTCIAYPYGDYIKGIEEYNKAIVPTDKIKVAVARP